MKLERNIVGYDEIYAILESNHILYDNYDFFEKARKIMYCSYFRIGNIPVKVKKSHGKIIGPDLVVCSTKVHCCSGYYNLEFYKDITNPESLNPYCFVSIFHIKGNSTIDGKKFLSYDLMCGDCISKIISNNFSRGEGFYKEQYRSFVEYVKKVNDGSIRKSVEDFIKNTNLKKIEDTRKIEKMYKK